jgi:hypothetical protein
MTEPPLPDPPIPAEADLGDWPYTPIIRDKLFGSSFHSRATDSEWRAGVTLWLKSWEQVPAGSLPDDDVDLCRLAELGRDLRTWRKVKTGALRGWYRCSDGRLYHPFVAEVVLAAYGKRRSASDKGKLGAQKRWHPGNATATKRDATANGTGIDMDGTGISQLMPGDSNRSEVKRREENSKNACARTAGLGDETTPPPKSTGDQSKHPADLLEQLQARYPSGTYRQAEWVLGHREAVHRLEEGFTVSELLDGVHRYRDQCDAKRSTGTQYVLSPGKFFARPKEGGQPPFTDPFQLPKTSAQARQDENVSAGLDWLRESGAKS